MRRVALATAVALALLLALVSCTKPPAQETLQGIGGLNNPPSTTTNNVTGSVTASSLTVNGPARVDGASVLSGTLTLSDSLRLLGAATDWDDLRIDGLSTRAGVVAPTDETGFRGSANFYSRNFVHNQADEVQFSVQMPHAWRAGSDVWPHVHFSPWATSAGSQAVRFVMNCYVADVNDTFPSAAVAYTMTKTWSGGAQWQHLLATSPTALDMDGLALSSLLKCRLWRDNTVANNFANKAAFLYFDVHYEVDSFGSDQEYIK